MRPASTAKVARAATAWYLVREDMKIPIAEYVHESRKSPAIPVRTRGTSGFRIAAQPKTANTATTAIIARQYPAMARNLPSTMPVSETGEEYSSLTVPLPRSLLNIPMDTRGIKR